MGKKPSWFEVAIPTVATLEQLDIKEILEMKKPLEDWNKLATYPSMAYMETMGMDWENWKSLARSESQDRLENYL